MPPTSPAGGDKDLTESHLAELAKSIQKDGYPTSLKNVITCDSDENIPYNASDDDDESDSEEEVIQLTKKRKGGSHAHVKGFDRVYIDNQQLWMKLSKTKAELKQVEERLHYTRLEHNNKVVEIDTFKKEIARLKTSGKSVQTKLQLVNNTLWWIKVQRCVLGVVAGAMLLHVWFGIDVTMTLLSILKANAILFITCGEYLWNKIFKKMVASKYIKHATELATQDLSFE